MSKLSAGLAEPRHPARWRALLWLPLAAVVWFSAAAGFAASISWGTATTISGDTDVITSGTLVYAYTGGNSGATVNGVAFAAGNSGTAWGGNVSLSGFGSAYSAYSGGTNAPWTNLTTAYKTVLQGGAYGGATTGTVTLKGLTVGHAYSVQIWVNDARSTGAGRSETATGANAVTLDYNSLNAQGGVGQYVIGSFAANSTNQAFTLSSSSSVQLNALNLRDNGLYVYTPSRVNLAKYQPVITDSTNGTQTAAFITEGFVDDNSCWVSDNTGPHWAQVVFPFPVTVGSAHLAMGLNNASPLSSFCFQYLTNGTWMTVPGSTVAGNANVERNIVFTTPITAASFRVYDSMDTTIRIRQLALYPPNGTNGYPFGTDFAIDLARKQPALATANTYGCWPLLAGDGLVSPSSAWETTLVGSNSLLVNLQFTNKLGSAHLYSGATGVAPLSDFVLQYWTAGAWASIPGGSVSGNTNGALVVPFTTPVTTTKVQLVFTNTGTSAVQELCIFPANSNGGYPLGTGVVSNTPSTADYDTYSDSYYYLSNAAAALVAVESNGVPVLGVPGVTNWAAQYQVLLNYDTGTYRLRNRATGLCLSGAQLTTNAGAALVDEDYSALPDQDWFLQPVDGTNSYLVNQYSGLVLDTQGGALVQNPLTNSPTQLWQVALAQIYPKKGIAGSWGGYPTKFQADWTYGWWYTGNPNLAGVNWFPMDSDSYYRGSTVAGNLWGLQPGWRTADYSLMVMGFNEPDHTDQANIDATNAAIYWLNDQNLDLPLVGPAAANVNGAWNATFFGYITNWGCRVDYLPGHEYGTPSGGSSSCWINPLQTAYNTYGIPMWMTEFGIVDWGGTGSWSEEDNYNALAEFMWRAESVPWLRKYSLFLFTASTNSPMAPNPWTTTTPAPRSNAYDTNGNLTPFGELYAAWDDDANVETNKVYYLHHNSTRKRLQNTLGANANATDIRVNDFSTKWTLQPAPGSSLYYIVSSLDGRRLSYNGSSVSFVAAGTTGTAVQWSLTAYQYGWFYLDHPATSKRLQLAFNNSTSVATFTMAANTTTSTAVQWRFIATLAPPAWTGFSDNSWTTPGNWSSQQSPLAGQSVTFNSLSISNLATTLNDDFSLSGLSVTTPAGPVSVGGTNTLTLGGGGLDLSGASQDLTIAAPLVMSADQTWTIASNRTLRVNGGLSDNGSGVNLNVAGGGVVSLGGAATYTGDTTVNAGGKLQMGAANVLPNGANLGNMIVNGTLDLNGTAQAINGLSGSGVVDNTADGAATLTLTNGSFSGTIRNSGGALALMKISTGSLTLSGTNTFAGGTTIANGTVIPGNGSALGTGTVTVNSGAAAYPVATMTITNPLVLNGGYLHLGGNNNTLIWSGPVTVANSFQMSADNSTDPQTLSGPIDIGTGGISITNGGNNGAAQGGLGDTLSGTISGSGGITYYVNGGNSRLTVQGANTYSGGTIVNGTSNGKLNVYGGINPFSTGTVTLNAGAVIDAYPGNVTITNALILNGGILEGESQYNNYNRLTWAGPITLTANSTLYQFGQNNGQMSQGVNVSGPLNMNGYTLTNSGNSGLYSGSSISGPISGTGTILETVNILYLSGSNTFTGNFRAVGGTLSVNNVYALQNATLDMNTADAGSVNFNNTNAIIGALTGTRNFSFSPNLSIGNNNANTTYSGVMSGSGSVTKIGTGTLTFSGANTYTGGTSINTGTLALSASGSLASTVITVAGGARFDVSGMSPPFVLGGPRTLTNSSVGAVLNGSSDCTAGTLSLVYDGVNPSFVQTNGTMSLSSGTVVKVNNTGAVLGGSHTIIAAAATGNHGWVTGTLPPVVVTGHGAVAPVSLRINGGGGLDLLATANNPTNISYSFTGGTLTLTWPGDHLGWIAQSNALSIANSNDWFDIPGSQSATNLVIPINSANTNVLYRLRHPN